MDIKSPQTRTTDRCDREVIEAWCQFVKALHGRYVPIDVLEATVQLDRALFTKRNDGHHD